MNTETHFDKNRRSIETNFPTDKDGVVLTLRVYHYDGSYRALVKRRQLNGAFFTEKINAASFNDLAPFQKAGFRARYSAKRLQELQEAAMSELQPQLEENLEWAKRF